MATVMMLFSLLLTTIPVIYALNNRDPFVTFPVACKIRTYLLQSSVMMYRWFLTGACIDRYASISINGRLRNFAKVSVAYRVIAMIMIIWLVLPVHILIFFNVKDGRCGSVYDIRVSLYHSIYTIITGNILPVSTMIVCAILIRHSLLLKRQRRLQLTTNTQNNNENFQHRHDRHIFVMLILQVIVYIITQTPWMFYQFYIGATLYVSNKSSDRVAIERFTIFIADSTIYLLPVLSFFLYTLASHTFRDELMKLLHCPVGGRRGNNINRIQPLVHNALSVRKNIEPIDGLVNNRSTSIDRK